ncbi:MAG: hypothetical protein NT011_13635 [Kiritimatiellaeota bacterium]|nr:hypothetical protein [Kiritimatiellota bacterium]
MDSIKPAVVLVIVVGLIAMMFWVFTSKMEAATFNSVTGKSVTTWQAMWIELRVQEPSK